MGFFRKEQTGIKKKAPRRRQCGACGLYKHCNSPKMDVSGQGNKKVFILGESPSQTEDRKGESLVGKGGQLLKKRLRGIGVDLEKDCWKINSVLCRATDREGNSRKINDVEIEYCRPSIIKELKEKKPSIILLLGTVAVQSFLGDRWQKNLGGIDKWRGWVIPDKDHNAFVVPIYHPNFVLRSEKNPVVETIFNNDIKSIRKYINKPFPELPDADKCCSVLTTKEEVVEYLEEILKFKPAFAFDYETTGLKPHAKGHRIASVGLCWQKNRAVAWDWKLTPFKLYKQIMADFSIKKIAANMKMEDHWTAVKARGAAVNGWIWDSMNASHVQDNRKGITSLKFDVYKRYGVVDYDSSVSSYLKSDNKEFGANGFNRVFEAPQTELRLYNAKDAFYTYHLACDQMEELGFIL